MQEYEFNENCLAIYHLDDNTHSDGELTTMNMLCSLNIIFHKKTFIKSAHLPHTSILQQQPCYSTGSVTTADMLQQQMCYDRHVTAVDGYNSRCVTTADMLQK
jgi:hypothetical protein